MKQNRIDEMFEKNREINRKALITFLTAGDPSIETTQTIIWDMVASGVDLIEIGIPFSDPMAEGPVIQEASSNALSNGVTLNQVMNMVKKLRERTQVPIVYLLYYNIIVNYGADHFFARCAEVGIDGVIIPDLPYEESEEIDEYVQKYNIYQIMMVAPTSEERMEKICKKAKGFLYCVSSLGVTGVRSNFKTDFKDFFDKIDQICSVPTCLGFGISSAEQVENLKQYCDGIIVGSAIVKRILEGKNEDAKAESVHQFVSQLREKLDD